MKNRVEIAIAEAEQFFSSSTTEKAQETTGKLAALPVGRLWQDRGPAVCVFLRPEEQQRLEDIIHRWSASTNAERAGAYHMLLNPSKYNEVL